MTRREFLRGLEAALAMDVPDSIIRNQLYFYDQYISDEIAKGRSEKEVMDELGDPRLIARTIEEAAEIDGTEGFTDGEFREVPAGAAEQQNGSAAAADRGYAGSSGSESAYGGGSSAQHASGSPYDDASARAESSYAGGGSYSGEYGGSGNGGYGNSGNSSRGNGSFQHGSFDRNASGRHHGRGQTFTEDGRPADDEPYGGWRGTVFQTNGTLGCLLLTIILVAVIALVCAIFTALAPILIPAAVVLVILWLLKGIMDR